MLILGAEYCTPLISVIWRCWRSADDSAVIAIGVRCADSSVLRAVTTISPMPPVSIACGGTLVCPCADCPSAIAPTHVRSANRNDEFRNEYRSEERSVGTGGGRKCKDRMV